MHILFVHNDYKKFSGEENAVQRISGLLAERGHRISWMRRSSAGLDDSLTKKLSALVTGIYSPKSRREMAELLASDRPDVVQVQNVFPVLSPSVLLACRDASVPVVMRCPNYRLFCPIGLHQREGKVCEECLGPGRELSCIRHQCAGDLPKSVGYAARQAVARKTGMFFDNVARFFVLSEFQKKRFAAGGIELDRMEILPNIADVDDAPGTPPPVDGLVSFVGRVSAEKGVFEFVEAARRLPHIQFAAAGAIEPELQGLVDTAPSNIRFTGFLSGGDLDDFYESSRIVVCPSTWFEGFPNVIAKAMAHGRPVVGAKIGAISEIVDDGITGLHAEPGNASQLTEKISVLWDDVELCKTMGDAGRRKAFTEYSEEKIYATLLRTYEAVSA